MTVIPLPNRVYHGSPLHKIPDTLSRRRPHLLPGGHGQPVPPLPSRWGLLAPMVDAPADAQSLGLARYAVRHSATAPHQDRRPRRRTEKADQDPPAIEHTRSGDLWHHPQPPAAPDHLNTGAWCPAALLLLFNPQRQPVPHIKPATAASTPHARPRPAATKRRAI